MLRMFSNRRVKIFFYILVSLVFIYSINEDIFYFYDIYTFNREFSPAVDSKGDYILTPQVILKKGLYTFYFDVVTESIGNGYFVIDSNDEIILMDEFLPGVKEEVVQLEILDTSKQVRIGVSYDPAGGTFLFKKVYIESDFIISRDSILRHFVVSLFLAILFMLLGWRIFYSASWFDRFGRLSSPANERILIFLVAISVITTYPYFYNKIYLRTDDYMFHLLRVEGIKVGLENGMFPVRMNPFFLEGYGYGDGLFYPNLTMYFPAVLRLLGFYPITAYKIFVILLNFLSIGCFYLAVSRISKSRYSGLIGAVFYAFASHRLIEILYRCGMGEAQSFLFTPIVILGLYEIFNDHEDKWYILAIGVIGLAWSHLLSLVLAFIAVAIFLLFRIKDILQNKKILAALIKAGLIVIGFCASFYFAMAEQLLTTKTTANILVSTISIRGRAGMSVIPGSHPFAAAPDWLRFNDPNMGLPLLLLPLVFLSLKKNSKNRNQQLAIFFLISGLVAVFVSTEWFPWYLFSWIANRLQFAWRVLIIAVPLLSLSAGLISEILIPQKFRKPALYLLVAISALSVVPLYHSAIQLRLVMDNPLHLESLRVSGGEYMPVGSDYKFIDKNKDTVLSNDPTLQVLAHDRKPLRFSFEFKTETLPPDGLRFEIPLLYYTGYVVEYEAPGKDPVEIRPYLGDHGFVAVDLRNEKEGRITAFYRTTLVQRLGDWITLLTLIGCAAYGLRAGWKKRALRRAVIKA